MTDAYSEARSSFTLSIPSNPNFVTQVFDKYAEDPSLQAMLWVSANKPTPTVKSLSYSHFAERSHRVACALHNLGLRKGDRVLLMLPRIPAWWELALGMLRSGIVLVPSTMLLVSKDIEYRLEASGARAFIGTVDSASHFIQCRKFPASLKFRILVEDYYSSHTLSKSQHEWVTYSDLLSSVPEGAKWEGTSFSPDDPSIIYFTSGTTGMPKMVQHTQISYPFGCIITGKYWLKLRPGKIYWNMSEQGWAKAAWSFFAAFNCGATLFIADIRDAFSTKNTIRYLHDYPITTLCAPPTAYRPLVLPESTEYLKAFPPKCLEHCVGAGEPLNPEVIRQWKQLTGIEIRDGYGQTETILLCGNFDGFPVRPGSMGKPSPGIELAILNAEGQRLVNEEGDISVLITPTSESLIFKGYRRGTDGNVKLVRPEKLDKDGQRWYCTGDRGYIDKEGYFWFVGRDDDVINSSGYRIGPFEVESALKEHPAVAESAVVGAPDPIRHTIVKAFVVLSPLYHHIHDDIIKARDLIKELQDFVKKGTGPYKYPRLIEFVKELPKTVSGKIRRIELRLREWEGHSKDGKKLARL